MVTVGTSQSPGSPEQGGPASRSRTDREHRRGRLALLMQVGLLVLLLAQGLDSPLMGLEPQALFLDHGPLGLWGLLGIVVALYAQWGLGTGGGDQDGQW